MSATERPPFEGWAILELMGHRRLGGYVSEATVAGAGFLRIDVPGDDSGADPDSMVASQFYSPSSVYCLTPVTEAMARAVAARNRPEPVQRWELPAPKAEAVRVETCDYCDEAPCSCGAQSDFDSDLASVPL
jgi:hypothetical protein